MLRHYDETILREAERVARLIRYDAFATSPLTTLFTIAEDMIQEGDGRGWQSLARAAVDPGFHHHRNLEAALIRLGRAQATDILLREFRLDDMVELPSHTDARAGT
jgi:hypothetical protein